MIIKAAFIDQTSSTSATGCCFGKMGDMDLIFDKANL